MDSTLPSKDHSLAKRKNLYMRHMLLTEINTGLGLKAGRTFTKPMAPENRLK
jgi:hypothetical protein